jgi:hypothetical protein
MKSIQFFKSEKNISTSEPDPKNPDVILHKVKLHEELPDPITDATVEVIEHLRAALDQAAFAVATSKGNKGTYFPFADSLAELDGMVESRCEFIPDEIVTLFRAFQPYKGGDNLLWALNKLCNAQKHRLIEPAGVIVGGMHIRNMTIATTGPGPFELLSPKWDREKNEIVFAKSNSEAKFKYDFELSLSISFGEVEVVGGQPVLAVIRAFTSKVESIVNATEAEARRIGLIE